MEESIFPTYLKNIIKYLDDEKKTTTLGTPRSNVGSNEMNPTPMTPSSTQYIWGKI
jgi:hypothetical protein